MIRAREVPLEILPLAGQEDAEWCARTMSASEPWITLGRGYEESLKIVQHPEREVWVARHGGARAGFLILVLKGAFVGYLQTVCIGPEARGQGLGSALLAFAEERIFREFKNVFLCVSSFNTGAKALYERLGYETVGVLRDYIVRGHDEVLMRKTRGPLTP
jgi:ribosomal protein S18 acetylase RimI-like enzyme